MRHNVYFNFRLSLSLLTIIFSLFAVVVRFVVAKKRGPNTGDKERLSFSLVSKFDVGINGTVVPLTPVE
jgi:hypothetical protein